MIIYIVNYGEREKSVFFGFFSGWADDLKISRVEFRLESRRDGFINSPGWNVLKGHGILGYRMMNMKHDLKAHFNL